MNREIKFRGKAISTGIWVYGDLVRDMSFHPDRSPEACAICWGNDYCPVDSSTVGQFTGLHDKNEAEIYEGDMVCCYDNAANDTSWGLDKKHIGEMVFLDGGFVLKCFTGNKKAGGNTDSFYSEYVYLDKWMNAENTEVIGHVYQNNTQ